MSAPRLWFEIGADLAPFNRGIDAAISRVGGLAKIAVAAALTAAAAGVVATGRAAIEAAAEMEGYETVLLTLMGSVDDMTARMADLEQIAQVSPFNLGDIVAAEVNLQSLTDASRQLLPGVIDLAAAFQQSGYTVQQSALDMGKAWSQGAAGMEGDIAKVIKQMISDQVGFPAAKLSIEEFRLALLDVLNNGKFAGQAVKLAATFTGMVSNLQDSWSAFLRNVARSSDLFDNLKGVLALTLLNIQANQDELRKLATLFGNELWSAIRLTVEGLAFVADTLRVGVGTAYFLAGAMDTVSAAIAKAQSFAVGLQAALARAAGMDRIAAGLDELSRGIGDAADASAAMATQHLTMAKELNSGGSLDYFERMVELLNEAEAMQFKLEGSVKRGQKGAAPAASDGSGKKDDTDAKMLDAINAYVAFYEDLQHMRDTDSERLTETHRKELEQAVQLTTAMAGTHQDYLDLKALTDANYYDGLREISDNYLKDMREKEKEALRDRTRMQVDGATEALDVTANMLTSIGNLIETANAKQKATIKALMIASAIMSTAAAIVRQYADLPLYAAIPASIAAAAAGAAQIATIATAHQGAAPSVATANRAPDERDVRILRDEAVLSTQATREGAQGLHDREFGRIGAAAPILQIGRYQWRELIRMDERTGGPLSQARRTTRYMVASGMSGVRAA